jgi:L-alanine-DL-glutamate epimerase-like enolase superfamily enzyme
LCSHDDGAAAIAAKACDLFNVRISKCGGLIPSLRLIEQALSNGVDFQLGAHPGQSSIMTAAEWAVITSIAVRTWEGYKWPDLLSENLTLEALHGDTTKQWPNILAPTGLGITPDMAKIRRAAVRTQQLQFAEQQESIQ